MSTSALGSWRNPPLAYVVVELSIAPHYSLAKFIPDVQEHLRGEYPRTLEGQELLFAESVPHAFWRFISANQDLGLHFGPRSISLHATTYRNSNDFLKRWTEVLNVVSVAGVSPFVERVGLRYIDLIVPSEGNQPEAYLADGLQGVFAKDAQPMGSLWAGAFKFGDSTVNLRTGAPSPPGYLLPPGFNVMPLKKPRAMTDAEARTQNNLPIGFIDTDCLRDIQAPFSVEELVVAYGEMQKLTSKTFKSVLSPLAKKEWE